MTNTQHTPAPWKIEATMMGIQNVHLITDGKGVDDNHTVAIVLFDGVRPQANAHLIAAAPELLEALEEMQHLHNETGNIYPKATAAIAKARGES